jgi:hypothetical protein
VEHERKQGVVALSRPPPPIDAGKQYLHLGLLQILDGRLARPTLERDTENALQRLQMLRVLGDQEPGKRVDRGKPGVARGDAVATLALEGLQESADAIGVHIGDAQRFDRALGLRAANRSSTSGIAVTADRMQTHAA